MAQLFGGKARGDVLDRAASGKLGEFRAQARRHDRYACLRCEQPFDLAMRDLAAADDDGRLILDGDEYRQIIHTNLDV